MSLDKAIRKATKRALDAQGSIASAITYVQTGKPGYDADKSAPTRPITSSIKIREAWFTSYRTSEIDGEVVQPMDQRMTIIGKDLGFEPKLKDYVLDSNNQQWEVMDYKRPISGAVHIFRVRRP